MVLMPGCDLPSVAAQYLDRVVLRRPIGDCEGELEQVA